MLVVDFAKERNLKSDTIRKHIRKNYDKYKDHIISNNHSMEIDDTMVEMLNEVYPLPKPVQVIKGVPEEEHNALRTKYESVLEELKRVQEMRIEETKQLAESKGALLLLEEKTQQLTEYKETIERANKTIDDQRRDLTEQKTELDKQIREKEEANKEIERLKNRTLWQRIRND